MKKRILALLLAVCLACAALAVPASASANTAVQAAVMLGGVDSGQDAAAPLTRGQLAKLLTAFSAYRGSAASAGSLFTDVGGTDEAGPAIRTAVSQGWMSGYSDGSFRPGQAVTLEEACAAALNLLGYDVTTLRGSFPDAQLNKARELGLRDGLTAKQGQTLTVAEGAQLLYNALTAPTAEGEVYGSTLGFAVTDGKVDVSSVLLEDVEGPFVAAGDDPLPFAPAAVYRNDQTVADASLKANDVYYYNVNARTLWIYTAKAAGRITAVAPSASAPTSVTVAGVEYTLAASEAAAALSSLNGGGVGQVVTLLLGMDDEVVRVLTGEAADQVFYGVVQSSSRSLTEANGADGGSLGGAAFAADVEILDTTGEGMAGTVRPGRLAGVSLSGDDVRYYTTNAAGEIDRLILDNVTGDLWTYGLLDDVRNLTAAAADAIDEEIGRPSAKDPTASLTGGTAGAASSATASAVAADVADMVLPSTSDILYGIIDGSLGASLWDSLTSSTGRVAAYALQLASKNTTGAVSSIFGWLGSGASYSCYIDGENTTLTTSVKYPVLAGGVAVGKSPSGTVKSMVQLMPVKIDRLGAASVMSGSTRYETADDMQVYLWYRGQYFATSLSQVDPEGYHLIGWYDNLGCPAGGKIRVLVAVKKD